MPHGYDPLSPTLAQEEAFWTWCAQAQEAAGDDWQAIQDNYSLRGAWEDGLTPWVAVQDALSWLNA